MILLSNTLNRRKYMKLEEYLLVVEKFLKDKLEETHMSGYVLGISGGIDSSLVAAIANKVCKDKLLCLILPCESMKEDEEDALKLVKHLNLNYLTIDLTKAYLSLKEEVENKLGKSLDLMSKSNMKVRLRMVTLYALASFKHYLVLGTDNKDERYLGYFTKYGDGAADLLPIVHLTKKEVKEAAYLYGLPKELVERVPSAGLFKGQSDEGEMGVTYEAVDKFLLGEKIEAKNLKIIERLHRISEHKREDIPMAPPYERE